MGPDSLARSRGEILALTIVFSVLLCITLYL